MYGDTAIEQLMPLLKEADDKKYLRENIIRIFVFMGLHDYENIFLEYLEDDYVGVRKACLHGIEKLKLKKALKSLEILIANENNEQIRCYAKRILDSFS